MKFATALSFLFAAFSSTDAFSPGYIKASTSTKLRDSTAAAMDAHMASEVAPPPPAVIRQSKTPDVTVQGGSLKTWAFSSPAVERVQVVLKTDGRPLDADVELWAGPDNTPHKMRIYVENGAVRPFSAVMETPRGPNTIAVRNIGQLEFPMAAQIEAVSAAGPLGDMQTIEHGPMTIQGGALRTYPFEPQVDSVQVLLKTDGRPLNARIELLQGPNNNKQVIELYTEDGLDRPFYAILETPGSGNVIRIVNTATVEFPLTCSCGAYKFGDKSSFEEMQPVISGYSSENRYGGTDRDAFKYGGGQN